MKNIFDLEIVIDSKSSSILAYPHLLRFFAAKQTFDASDMIIGSHMAYGWMPTALDLYTESLSFDSAAQLITKAKRDGVLADEEIINLMGLINRSLVGTTKLLHFVSPKHFPIFDSRIYRFLFGETPHHYRVNNIERYREYLAKLDELIRDDQFNQFHKSVNEKLGYEVTDYRALELVMFIHGADKRV